MDTNTSLSDLVDEFLQDQEGCCADEDEFYAGLDSLETAIEFAALAKTATGAISNHQRQWVDRGSMAQSGTILLAAKSQIASCRTFDSLLVLIQDLLVGVPGLGELYYYDTARRIGAFLSLFPTRVYLHRGTRDGAKALGLDHKKPYLSMSSLPAELRKLEPKHVEDFLCRYKERLKALS